MSAPTRKCGVSSCKHHHNPAAKGSDVYFFKIPSVTTEYGKKWVAVLKTLRTNFFGSHVCSLHFNRTDIEECDTKIKGVKYVKLRRGAVPSNCALTPPAKEALCDPQLKETVRIVDIEAIKKNAGAQNIADDEIPLKPLIIQPQLSTQSSSEAQSQQTHHQQSISCGQCKIYSEKLKLSEKRCRELEEFIRTNWNSENVENEKLLKSILSIENSITAGDSRSSRNPNGNEEALTDNDDTLKFNDNEYLSTEMPSDSDNSLDTDTMDVIDSKMLKIMDPSKSQSSVAEHPIVYHNIDPTIHKAQKVDEINEHRDTNHKRSTKTKDSETRPVKTASTSKLAKLKPFECAHCNECFKTAITVSTHMRRLHGISTVRTFECYICREKFKSIGPTKLHLKQHIRTECEVCHGLQTKLDSDEHVCSGLKSVSCVYCQQLFLTTKSLLQHLEECKSEKVSYECGKCLKSFLMETLADCHRKTHEHGEQTRPFVCSTCSRGFYCRDTWRKHEKSHNDSRDYLCDECGKGFKCHSLLRCHQRATHNKKAYKCPHCNVTNLGEANHANHMRRHRNVKFVCNICGLQLVSRQKLTIHKRIHTRTEADRIHGCSICDKKFFTKKASRSHFVNAHQPIRFECDLCNQSYKYKGDLNKHKRVVHAIAYSYMCPHCDKGFIQSYQLNEHLFEHTEET